MDIAEMALTGTVKVLKNAFKIFAEEDKQNPTTPDHVQLWIGTRDENNCEPYYWLIKNGEPCMRQNVNPDAPGGYELSPEVYFNQILGQRVDLLGKGLMAAAFLRKAIARFAAECDTDPRNIELQIITGPGPVEPIPFLYDRGAENPEQPVKQLSWRQDVFQMDEKMFEELAGGSE